MSASHDNNQRTFEVDVTNLDRVRFAELSGDFNPLHTDDDYAAASEYGRCVLHGAFSAGLFSRMAGMVLPGKECLLHGMTLRFVRPIIPPVRLRVVGSVLRDDGRVGEVAVSIIDANGGQTLTTGTYQFGRHRHVRQVAKLTADVPTRIRKITDAEGPSILVTGATGGLGSALLDLLGDEGLGVSRSERHDLLIARTPHELESLAISTPLKAIVHCAWPSPDNEGLLDLTNSAEAIERHVSEPLQQVLALARLLRRGGRADSVLILIGSTSSRPGRHAWRMPLYSAAKRMLETIVPSLAVDLTPLDRRVIGVSFDVLDGGMNRGMSEMAKQGSADRTLTGRVPTTREAAEVIRWIIKQPGYFSNGSILDFSGGALP